MSHTFIFTAAKLHAIQPPKDKEDVYRDQRERGLILRVRPSGRKTFYFYRAVKNVPVKKKIGYFPQISIEEARLEFGKLRHELLGGEIIGNTKLTFKELLDKYARDYGRHHIGYRGFKERISLLNRKIPHLYDIEAHKITRDQIQEAFNTVTKEIGKRSANLLITHIQAIFNKAIEWDLIDKNPVKGIKKHREKSRERYITKEEMPRFLGAVSKYPDQIMRDFILIALFSGQRKSNVLSMRWQDISFKNETWSIEETKNGDPHLVPLTNEAIVILKRRFDNENKDDKWVFPSPSKAGSSSGHLQEPKKAWKKILEMAEIEDLRIHDLRRTCGSWMAIDGASQYVIGKMLGHKSYQSTSVYARLSNEPVKKCISNVSSSMVKDNEHIL